MGNQRKNKGQASSQHASTGISSGSKKIVTADPQAAPSTTPHQEGKRNNINTSSNNTSSAEFFRAMQEVEGVVFRISWKEVLCLLLSTFALFMSSVVLAIMAEISIEIHYFDKQPRTLLTSPSFSSLDARERALNLHRRVTMVEPEMAAIIQKGGRRQYDDNDKKRATQLQRVVHVSSSGHAQALLVVEEQTNEFDGKQRMLQSSRNSTVIKPPKLIPPKILPKLCSDKSTVGFDDWSTLNAAIQEANRLSVDRFVRWSRFFAETDTKNGSGKIFFEDESLYYEQDILLTVCPGATLKARKGPIYVNTPNLVLDCGGEKDCTIKVGGSHFSFGPHAKNVLIRGFIFSHASSTSLLFPQSGADVSLDDCAWHDNSAMSVRMGAVADINSTSSVSFYRCQMGQSHRGEAPGSSLSVRT